MTLDKLFLDYVGVYTPIMVNNNWALDVPYIFKGAFLLITLYSALQVLLVVIRGLFRR